MTKVKDELIDLAKSGDIKTTGALKKGTSKKSTGKKKRTVNKNSPKKSVVTEATPEELRNQKAKETVEKLLEDSPIVILDKQEDNLMEIEQPITDEPKGVEWLEQQVTLLTEKNAELTTQMDIVKGDFEKILKENQQLKENGGNVSGGDEVKKAIIQLFNEIQENHIKLGVDKNGIGNFRIYCPGFLNRLIKFFPFLSEIKRY